MKKKFLNDKVVVLVTCIILCSTAVGVPTIYGAKLPNDETKDNLYQPTNNKLEQFLSQPLTKNEIALLFLLANKLQNSKDTYYSSFMKLLKDVIENTDESDLTILNLHYGLGNKLRYIYEEIGLYIDGKKTFDKLDPYIQDMMVFDTNSYNNGDFEEYWKFYYRAKGFWAGYIADFGDFDPSVENDVRNWLWHGENFDEWYEKAGEEIWGDEDRVAFPDSTFEKLNLLSAVGVVGSATISILCMIAGIVSQNEFYFALGVFPLLTTIAFGLFILLYDFYSLMFFLAGINALLQLLDHGNANIVVHVVEEDGSGVDGCKISCYSHDANLKTSEPNWESWPWNMDEFTYDLVEVQDDESEGIYSLHDRPDQPVERLEKAVPPPGLYGINVVTKEGKILLENEIIGPISPNRTFYLSVVNQTG